MFKEVPIEKMFNPKENFEVFLDSPKFHHSRKGCDVYMFNRKALRNNPTFKFCITHNKECSKTGWESGWYLGNSSKEVWLDSKESFIKVCQICKKEFKTNKDNQFVCSRNCQLERNRIKGKKDREIYQRLKNPNFSN